MSNDKCAGGGNIADNNVNDITIKNESINQLVINRPYLDDANNDIIATIFTFKKPVEEMNDAEFIINLLARRLEAADEDLKSIKVKANKFLDDVMPQIGKLCIQDFQNLNELGILLNK